MDSPESFVLPKQVPIFPLPNAILFPYLDLPLYIFEPRYQEMLTDVLNDDRMMGLMLMKEGWEEKEDVYPMYDVCGLGMVKFASDNEDGTSHIILGGLARVEIKEWVQKEPYLIAEIKVLEDFLEESNEEMALSEKVKELFIRKEQMTKIVTQEHIENILQIEDASRLCDIIAFFSTISFVEKQKVLEVLNVKERLRLVLKILEDEIRHLESKN